MGVSVLEAVQAELERLGGQAGESALAATALSLAEGLDGENSLTSKSMAAKALVDVLKEVRSLAPPQKETDDLAKLRERRDKRRSTAADSARS